MKEYKFRLSSQLECELSEEQELRNIIANLEKDLELQRSTNQNLQQFLMQKDSQIQELELKEQVHKNSLETQKRLSDHWRITIAQEREKLVADRTRYEKERTALLTELEQERHNSRELEVQLQAQISILKHELETDSQSSHTTLHELWSLSESLVVKIHELTELYNSLILNRPTGATVSSPMKQIPKDFADVPMSQVAQKLRGQTAVLAELSYSAFRVLQTTQQEMQTKKDQVDSVLASLEKEIQVSKQSYNDLLNIYEQEKQSNSMNVDKIQASEQENTSLRRELDQLLPRITETPKGPRNKTILSEAAESIDTSDKEAHSPSQTRKRNTTASPQGSPKVQRNITNTPTSPLNNRAKKTPKRNSTNEPEVTT
jgi:DNA repair exonuclease SbcCD ATPase subunit